MNDPIALLQGKPTPPQRAFFESKARHTAYGGARGGGKAQPVDEPVLTPFGFRRMGELNVGSIVSNPDGGTARVIQVHPQGVKPIYRVTLRSGAETRCTGDHLWNVMTGGSDFVTVSLSALLEIYRRIEVLVPQFKQANRCELSTIQSISSCGKAECQCITVDNPNGLYITKDFIVTHNSWAMRRKMVGLGLAPYGGIRMLLLRRSFPELLGNHIRPLIEELVPSGMAKYNKDEKIFIFPNGSYIKLGFCDSEDDWMQYQGQEYEVIGFEEATNFTELQMRKIATSNRTSRKDFKPRCYYTCNPGGVGHEYIKRLFVDRNFITEPIMFEGMEILPEDPNDYVFIRAKLSDNPHVDSDYIKSLAGLPEHLRRAYLEGDWDVVLGQYFSEFRRDLHVIPTMAIPPEWKRFRAMDWGFNDPWATLWFAVAPDRHIYAYRELYAREINSSDYARMVKQMTGADEHISGTYLSPDAWQRRGMKDISGGENIAEVLMRNGIPVFKADNSRVIGWQRVRENLAIAPDGKPWLQIMDCCTNLIRTFPNATVDPNDIEDVSDHCEDHCVTGDTLITTLYGEVPISELVGRTGDCLCLLNGEPSVQTFHSVRKTRENAEVYEVETEDGTTFRATGDHLVLLSTGEWKEVQNLTDADSIVRI